MATVEKTIIGNSRPHKRRRLSWKGDGNGESDDDPPIASTQPCNQHILSTTNRVSPKAVEFTTRNKDTAKHGISQVTEDYDQSSPSDQFVSPAATSVLDEYAANPRFLELQEELRSLLFTGAQSNAPSRAPTPDTRQDEDQTTGQVSQIQKEILCNSSRHQYLKNYFNEVAPWLDMFDMRRHFGVQIPLMARESSSLPYAMLALSARHLERKHSLQKSCESLELYQESIRLLTPSLEARDPNILATCVILCCLEMMSASPRNWRRHLEGCAALFQSFGVNGFTGGLLQAVFWCYTRMDLSGVLISEGMESTVLPLSSWLPPKVLPTDVASLIARTGVPDMHANYAVYLCSRVCDLLAERTKATEFGIENLCTGEQFISQWHSLWNETQSWREDRPPELIPVKVVNANIKTLFPSIFFAHWAAISSNQLYHTACVLMLSIAPSETEIGPAPYNSPLWHARRIVGISMTNPHEGCLNNSLQPLWIAGKLLSHRSEHIAIVKLIRSIEQRTGWGMCWRIKDLEEAWGYERGELKSFERASCITSSSLGIP